MTVPRGREAAQTSATGELSRIAYDPEAFEGFYRAHVTLVTRFVARRVADPHMVADLTAEVFLAALGSAHAYRPGKGSPVAWLYGVARNVIAQERRRAAYQRQAASRIAGRRLLDGDDIARPGMPTRPAALRAWLDRENHLRPGDAIGLLWVTEPMLATDYLTPAQRAATYDVLAQTPGLRIVPRTATLLGHTGVGVRWTLHIGPNKNSTYTLVFNRMTYQLLGMNWTGRLGLNGAAGGDVVTQFAIVSRAGQLP